MKLEDQVVSLELAKKLKELGVKQDSILCWLENRYGIKKIVPRPRLHKKTTVYEKVWGAFSVAELGEMLPAPYPQKVCKQIKTDEWIAVTDPIIQEKKEADARALMLIDLIKKGLVNA